MSRKWLGGGQKTIFNFGIVRGQLLYPLFAAFNTYELSEQDLKEINNYFTKNKRESGNNDLKFNENCSLNNVIFLLLESYLSVTSDMRIGDTEVTPFLNSLKHNKKNYYNGSVISNVDIGESADGQFIYMAGLLPLRGELAIPYVEGTNIPTWVKGLKAKGYKTMMTIPTPTTIWGQDKLSPLYGFDELYGLSGDDYFASWISDKILFENAMKNEAKFKDSKMLHVILSVSTHSPYIERNTEYVKCNCYPSDFPEDWPDDFNNYLLACHFMDHQIEKYFNNLADKGEMNNTMIVIASDHGIRKQYFTVPKSLGSNANNVLPLYICNVEGISGISNKPMNQIDVFPTLLQILGIEQDWKGFGYSAFSNKRSTITKEMQDISDKILKGKYFK